MELLYEMSIPLKGKSIGRGEHGFFPFCQMLLLVYGNLMLQSSPKCPYFLWVHI